MSDPDGGANARFGAAVMGLSVLLMLVFYIASQITHIRWMAIVCLVCVVIVLGGWLTHAAMSAPTGTLPPTAAAGGSDLRGLRVATELGVFDVVNSISIEPDNHQATVMAVDRMGTVGVLVIGFDSAGAVVRAAIHNQPWMRAWPV